MRVRVGKWTCLGSTLLVACGGGLDESIPSGEVTATETAALTAQEVEPYAPQANWTSSAFSGANGTFYADVNNDGRADAIALNANGISVRTSSGSPPLNGSASWLGTAFIGAKGNFFADVNNDGKADAIAVNTGNVLVRKAGSGSFGASETWSSTAFFGSALTLVADVTGDGRADLIAFNGANVQVRASTGTAFGAATTWASSAFTGTVGTFAADVTGDGKADLIAVNSGNILVRASTGSAFASSTTWSSVGFSGARGTFVADVTGDKTADIVAIDANGIRMRRSSRWFFGTTEEKMSTLATASSATRALADLTGDGRADYIERPSTNLIQARARQDRVVPLRIVQYVNNCGEVRSDSDIQTNIDAANLVHGPAAGLKFVARTVATNPDCPGYTKSHVVLSPTLANATSTVPASPADLELMKNRYNPACNVGYSDIADVGYNEQMWWVAARCSLPGEVLVNIADVGTNAASSAGDGNLALFDRWEPFDPIKGRFAHELGHYLGLDHSFWFGYYGLIGYMDPDTGQGQQVSAMWDLAHAGTLFFNSRAEAAAHEDALQPIEAGDGWFCPSGDAAKPCPFTNPPQGTIGMTVTGDINNVIYTYLPQTTTFDSRMKGIAPRHPSNLPGLNQMSYAYLPEQTTYRWGLSLSQTEVIQKNLSKDLLTKYLDADGRVIFGKRPALGITNATPAEITFQQAGTGSFRTGQGSIAANGFNAYAVSTTPYSPAGFSVVRWDGRLRQWSTIFAGAYQVALPSGGADTPWAIVNADAGPVKRWNGGFFGDLPNDPNGTCARSLAVGDFANGQYAWAISCVGPNFDGNYRVMRYNDATGWVFFPLPAADGYGLEITVDWQGVPWVTSRRSSGFVTIFRANITPQGELLSWTEVPPPFSALHVMGGAASYGTRLPVNMIASDGNIYTLKKSTLTWTQASGIPFTVGEAAGALPYLWLVNQTNGSISYAR